MKTVAMCGSMRFADQMRAIAFELETAQGMCVLTCVEPVSAELSQAERAALGRAHLHKIELADAVYVVDPGGYIGEAVREELRFAEALGKEIIFHSRFGR